MSRPRDMADEAREDVILAAAPDGEEDTDGPDYEPDAEDEAYYRWRDSPEGIAWHAARPVAPDLTGAEFSDPFADD